MSERSNTPNSTEDDLPTPKGYARVRVYGHIYPTVLLGHGVHCCGGHDDLVTFEFGNEGSWCLPFEDLERFYLDAKAVRK